MKQSHTKCSSRIKSMQLRGTTHTSLPEQRMLAILTGYFGVGDVIHQKPVNGWAIDFYVKSIDTCIQVDGVYWHGLDRDYDTSSGQQLSKRERMIEGTMKRDQEQCDWFKAQGRRFCRITDAEMDDMTDDDIIECIMGVTNMHPSIGDRIKDVTIASVIQMHQNELATMLELSQQVGMHDALNVIRESSYV